MTRLAFGALLIGLSAACGGGGGVKLLDASGDAVMACNPIAQTGCMASEKCTWVVDIDAVRGPDGSIVTNEIGHVGCAAVGAAPLADGAACSEGVVAGGGTGFDTCVAGDLCISGKCKPICDPQLVSGSGKGACAADFACAGYSGVFVSGGAPTAGVCEPGCDPLTQAQLVGSTHPDACGSTTATAPSATCVPSSGFKSFHCAPTGSRFYTKTDRVAPETAPDGTPFGNGCAPGFIPFYFEDASGAMKTLCSGLCAPVKVDSTIAAVPGNEKLNEGDATAMGKLPTELAAVGKSTCAANVKGSDAINGEDCRFVWLPLVDRTTGIPANSPYNDTLGVCFAFAHFLTIDTNNDGRPDAPEKSCKALGTTADPIYLTAEQNGCYPLADSMARTDPAARSNSAILGNNPNRLGSYRLSYSAAPLMRHALD
jgi:hypothetical protein